MVYIVVILILVFGTVFLINWKFLNGFRERRGRTFEFFIALISTFIAFFVALTMNSFLNVVNDKKNLVKFLTATNLTIENAEMKTKGMYILPAKSGTDITEILQYSPVVIPRMFSNMQDNVLVGNYFSSNAFQAYILCDDNLRTFVMSANDKNLPVSRKVVILEKYLKYLGFAAQVNALEIKRLNGDISKSEADNQLKTLTQEIVKK